MKPSAKALLALSFLVGVGGSVFMVRGVGAQGSYTPPLNDVRVTGTVDVSDLPPVVIGESIRLDTNVTNTVGVTGSVELGPSSSALLAGRMCTYGSIGHILLDGGVQGIAGMSNRTGVIMVAHSFGSGVDYVSCWPGLPDGGQPPNCTVGTDGRGMPIHEGGSASFDVSNAYVVRCLTCNHSGGAGSTTAILSGANSQCTP